jgi:hypothetical protein
MGFLIFIIILFGSMGWATYKLINFFFPNFFMMLGGLSFILPYVFSGAVLAVIFMVLFSRPSNSE